MLKTLKSEAVTPEFPLRAVDRAIGELRRGRSLLILGAQDRHALVASAELASPAGLEALRRLGGSEPRLALTRRRALALGLASDGDGGVLCLSLGEASAKALRALADPLLPEPFAADSHSRETVVAETASGLAEAAIELTKLAHLLPAAALCELDARAATALPAEILRVPADAISAYRIATAEALDRVSEARVPLFDAENARIITFRPRNGGFEHLAIVIGTPEAPALVRLHSECLTGDLLGSLRCDCGDQLRGAIQTIAKAGSGVLLYLAQEGRGIGLANKLRAYGLQDRGADTLEANEQLGFDPDERIFVPAASMLGMLGIDRIRLLTNNPQKEQAMARLGIEVTERVPLVIPSNPHNADYLDTKARRFGHQF
ncbi:MAG: GTP cyclohydrolase II [Kiloniellales bacterium]|nr:GTP cyclohydrolase II [Kiloniellales bacterium]